MTTFDDDGNSSGSSGTNGNNGRGGSGRKRGKYFEIELNEQLYDLGFRKVSINEKNIVVQFEGVYPIISTFKLDEIEKTLNGLRRKMIAASNQNNGAAGIISKETAERLIVFLSEEFLKLMEEEQRRQE